MSSKREISFDIEIPHIDKDIKKEKIEMLKNSIEKQYDEVYRNQDVVITKDNKKAIEDLILATKDLIDNGMKDAYYSGNRDENFINLIYICHKIDLKLETYKLQQKIDNLIIKNKNIEEKQKNIEDKNNNLVYNLLGFLASFSIVSASVAAIEKVNGTLNIIIVVAFAVFLLLTTLIGLHNFYKSDNKRENKLQDNYFLWKATGILIVVLIILSGINYIKNNKEEIFNYVDTKIENIIEKKVNGTLYYLK